MVDLGSRMIDAGTNTNSGKSILASRVSFGSIVESKSKVEIHIREIHILFPSMECDNPKLVIQFLNVWVRK